MTRPSFTEEEKLWRQGYRLVAGIDEAGRGPLAGPVVASAVILSPERGSWLYEVQDSKRLMPRKREFLSSCIWREAAVGVGPVPPETIDEQGIVSATKMAMRSAVDALPHTPDRLLVDGIILPETGIPGKTFIKGDSVSLSIAAASIVAKVYRDQMMVKYDSLYPGYGFARNKGYATAEHLAALCRLRHCPIHRISFAKVPLERDG